MTGITIDGVFYDVKITYPTLSRAFSVKQGVNAGTAMSGRDIPDVVGTACAYTMSIEPNPANRTAYDSFVNKIFTPADYVRVRVPYGQTSLQFDARVMSGGDTFGGTLAGTNVWDGLRVTFAPIRPQWSV